MEKVRHVIIVELELWKEILEALDSACLCDHDLVREVMDKIPDTYC